MTIKDSGHREHFDTGAVRDIRTGKGRFDLLPWYTIRQLSRHFEAGCQKYGDRNWEKGIPTGKYLDSAFRHLAEFALGHTDEAHLNAAIWNLHCLMDTIRRIECDELPQDLHTLPVPLKTYYEYEPEPATEPPALATGSFPGPAVAKEPVTAKVVGYEQRPPYSLYVEQDNIDVEVTGTIDPANADAVFSSAGSAFRQGKLHNALIGSFGAGHFFRIVEVDEKHGVEVAVTDMAEDGRLEAASKQIRLGLKDRLREAGDGHTDICRHGKLAGLHG